MIYYDVHNPDTMPGKLLDEYLRHGWYRMQQTIFTTDIILKNDVVVPVFWIRLLLKRYGHSRNSRRILSACSRFSVTVTGGEITAEDEELYQVYKSSVSFDVSETIKDYLVGESPGNIYDTKCVKVRDGNTLIATGYFDEGRNSLAGILNIIHPDYKRFSLGKYLMLLKIERAVQLGMEYYYPGYISSAISKFDYKLFPGPEHTEVYIRNTDSWRPWLSVQVEKLEEWLFAGNGE